MAAAFASQLCLPGLASAQDNTAQPPAQPPAAAPATPPAPAVPPADQPVAQPAAPAGQVVTGGEEVVPGKKERTEEIVVTGTRIRRKDLTTPAPVTVINRDQIAASGKVRIGDFLQTLPEQGNAINTQFNNGGDGATRVSLRGLGSARTLVLINGRRVVPGGTGADASVDLNSIPSQAIERVEILKDGASAVYGSDAIAGVVNLITRKNFAGSQVAAYAGTSQRGDGTAIDTYVSSGTSSDRGNIMFSAGYFKQLPIWAGDRNFSKVPLNYNYKTGKTVFAGSSATPAGLIELNPDVCTNAKCTEVFNANGGAVDDFYTPDPTFPGGFRIMNNNDLYNFQPDNYLVTPQQRIQLFAIGDTKLGDVARGYFEASYVNRQSSQTLAPEPLFADQDPLFVSKDSIYNPFANDLPWVSRRLTEFGRRTFTQDLDTFRVAGGVDGTLPDLFGALSGWFWDVSLNYGRTQGVSTTKGTLRAPLVQDAIGPSMDPDGSVKAGLGPSGDEVCVRTAGVIETKIPGCVPLDIVSGRNSITAPMIGALGFTGTTRGNNVMTSVQANASGELFRLLADRPMGLAVGYEFRDLSGAFIPDPITAAGENTGNNTKPAEGSYNVNEAYAELSIPIVNNLPFAQDIEATIAARYSNYSTFGGHTTYKAGARWRIIPDVTVRGTYSTAFRAPSIADLYSGQYESFESVSDPCASGVTPGSALEAACIATNKGGTNAVNNGDPRTQIATLFGGNPKLNPETAKIFTVGLVWEPSFVKNLSVTVDFYRMKLDNSISSLGAGLILDSCFNAPAGQSKYCDLVARNGATGRITSITDTSINVGGNDTSGIDAAARYSLPTPVGRWGIGVDGTWLNKFDEIEADGTVIRGKGTYDLGVYPEWKFNAGLTWGLGALGAGVTARYIGWYDECANASGGNTGGLCFKEEARAAAAGRSVLRRSVGDYAVADLFVTYGLNSRAGKTNLAVGVNNVFDKNPQTVYAATSTYANSDPTAYDYIGRFFYVRLEHSY